MNKLLKLLALGALVATPVTSIIACDSGPSKENEKINWDEKDAINNLGNLTFEEKQDGKFLIKSDKFEFTKTGEKEILLSTDSFFWLETKLYGDTSIENQWGYEIASYIKLEGAGASPDFYEEAIKQHNKVNEKILYAPDDILVNNKEGIRYENGSIEIANKNGNQIILYFSSIFYDFVFWYVNDFIDQIMIKIVTQFNEQAEEKNWPGKLEFLGGSLNFSGADLDDKPEESESYFSIIDEIFVKDISDLENYLSDYNLNSEKEYIKKIQYSISSTSSSWSSQSNWLGVDFIKKEYLTENIHFDTADKDWVDVPTPIRITINNIVE